MSKCMQFFGPIVIVILINVLIAFGLRDLIRSRQRMARLEGEVKKQGEVIVFLYNAMATNKVNITYFIEHVQYMEQTQNKINAVLGDAIAIIGKDQIKQREEREGGAQ